MRSGADETVERWQGAQTEMRELRSEGVGLPLNNLISFDAIRPLWGRAQERGYSTSVAMLR